MIMCDTFGVEKLHWGGVNSSLMVNVLQSIFMKDPM
jgi:hypothetical protein